MEYATDAQATIAICTRNRKNCALRVVATAFKQKGCGEVVVIDDASDDGTKEAVMREFPAVRLHRFSQNVGVAAARSQGIRMARYPVIVEIDDDAYFDDPETVVRTLQDFRDPRIAAIAMPLLDRGCVLQPAAPDERIYLTRYFFGGAHALRRDVVLAVGAYRSTIRFSSEESDLCIRMLDRGYVTAVGTASPVLHVPPGDQVWSQRRKDLWTNDVLFKWHFTPWIYLPLAMASHPLNHAGKALREGHFVEYLSTTASAMFTAVQRIGARQPVQWSTYRFWRTLARRGMAPLSEVERILPTLRAVPGIERAARDADHLESRTQEVA